MNRRTIKQHDQTVSSIVSYLMAMADSPTGKGIRAQGARYNGPWDWFIQHGSVMASGHGTWTEVEQPFLRDLNQGADFRKGECYANAQWALERSLSLSVHGVRFTYCEGYAAAFVEPSMLPEPFGHAWCLVNDRVWDPSPVLVNPTSPRTYVYLGAELLTSFVQESLRSKTVRAGYSIVDNPWRDYPVLRNDVREICPSPA